MYFSTRQYLKQVHNRFKHLVKHSIYTPISMHVVAILTEFFISTKRKNIKAKYSHF